MLDKLQQVNVKQKELMLTMSKEKCDDIHSVLRSKQLAENILQLEVQKDLLILLISKQK